MGSIDALPSHERRLLRSICGSTCVRVVPWESFGPAWLVRPCQNQSSLASEPEQHLHAPPVYNHLLPPTAAFFFPSSNRIPQARGDMLAEEFISSICGPPLSSNTAIAKDVGIYIHSLWPTFAAKSAFKKSSTPTNCLAANETHVFAAQHEKAYVHVYSRLRGNQESFVAFPERIRCLTLAGDVLILGTVEGRIMLWEVGSPGSNTHKNGFRATSLTVTPRLVPGEWFLCLPVMSRPCPA
jgi:hypothetical protein